jgi:hypothetical protein
MLRQSVAIVLLGISLCGCAVHEAYKDHDLIRNTLLELYTNQIMDNIIRTANGMPIIQLDYTNAAAQVTITNTIGGSDSQVTTASNVLALPAATLSATRTIMTTLMGNISNMNSNQISIAATPAITSNDVYDAYISFLDEQKHPGILQVTPERPSAGAAQICRRCDGKYYWIPIAYRKEFFALSLATTSQRGTSLQAADSFFTVKLNSPFDDVDNPTFPGSGRVLTFDIDKQQIPIDLGDLVLDSDTTGTKFKIQAVGPATTAASPNHSTATSLQVYVPNEPKTLRLDKDGNLSTDGENLFYVSKNNNDQLRFLIRDANGQIVTTLQEEDPGLPQVTKDKIAVLKPIITSLWDKPLNGGQKNLVLESIASIVNYELNTKRQLFRTLPQTAKLYLQHNVPKRPTTEDALNRANFLLQSIQLNQLRQPSSGF